MKSIPWLKAGNWNLRGKKTKTIMIGKHAEDTLQNLRDKERDKISEKEMSDPDCWASAGEEHMNDKDPDVIPSGFYCYDILEIVKAPDGMPIVKTKVCPYWERLGKHEDQKAYCHFIEEEDDLLLWDQVKICSVRNTFEDEFGEEVDD